MLSAMALSCSLEGEIERTEHENEVGRENIVVVEGIVSCACGHGGSFTSDGRLLGVSHLANRPCINDLAVAYLSCIRGRKTQRAAHHILPPIFT